MTVFPITFIVSGCLLAMFILFFARENSRHQRKRGVDQEALLPLEEETPRVVGKKGDGKGSATENISATGNGAATGSSPATGNSPASGVAMASSPATEAAIVAKRQNGGGSKEGAGS